MEDSQEVDISQERLPSSSSNRTLRIILFTLLVLLLGAGLVYGGYQYGRFEKRDQEKKLKQERRVKSYPQFSTITPSLFSNLVCKTIPNLVGYKKCVKREEQPFSLSYYIIHLPNGEQIKHVEKHTILPTREWMFVVRFSDAFVKTGGAPQENAIDMVDIKNGQVEVDY